MGLNSPLNKGGMFKLVGFMKITNKILKVEYGLKNSLCCKRGDIYLSNTIKVLDIKSEDGKISFNKITNFPIFPLAYEINKIYTRMDFNDYNSFKYGFMIYETFEDCINKCGDIYLYKLRPECYKDIKTIWISTNRKDECVRIQLDELLLIK